MFFISKQTEKMPIFIEPILIANELQNAGSVFIFSTCQCSHRFSLKSQLECKNGSLTIVSISTDWYVYRFIQFNWFYFSIVSRYNFNWTSICNSLALKARSNFFLKKKHTSALYPFSFLFYSICSWYTQNSICYAS